ncbi:Trehalose utilization [Crateriforma conspicua]|nr:Trehalose utilization [Crateriforma conspicua]
MMTFASCAPMCAAAALLSTLCFASVHAADARDDSKPDILMIAGSRSHGYGAHEHYAGLKILEEAIVASTDRVNVRVVRGWPEDKALVDDAESIVIYCDGGGRHLALEHRDALAEKMAAGCGFVCLHYAVEVPPSAQDDWLAWLGGNFELNYSVNPHWHADFANLPDHPVTAGVKPFGSEDEWYFHLRFTDQPGLQPILSAVAPPETMRRKDGAHSGNPHVRKSVARGDSQTVAWVFDRPDGGRSFGFTGGHFHWNWGHAPVRRLVTNAIRWTAGESLDADGSQLQSVKFDDLLENQDYDPPKNFNKDDVFEKFELQNISSVTPMRSITGAGMLVRTEDPRHPENAIAGIDVAPGVAATLVASEPTLRSLTNLDIDDRGRIWLCDVMNYRRRQGARPEGDRILILEDTDGDGVADDVKTFYQGRDIDSAMGICVLGNEIIVSASPSILKFTDTNGDDVPDRKEVIYTDVGQPQHDHSAHSFLFGDDGKLYWNFGNTGMQVKDAKGQTVVDIHGRPVVDNGQPFYGGMPFRTDLDGSNFEVLAHNFRNNWETTVDSFGTLWQSDNDDDGNRGTRINFVMQHGNYGYRDELTGASWKAQRITMDDEIPLRHWHLNDPGVVPNVLQTGAGSPSGICMYEGQLLPKRFWNQVIHCDPGPNVVRAYPMKSDGAGYTADIDPILTGTRDQWFRPADVCVAPDGSLFVTDWYDPGVGGHRQEDSDRGRLFRVAPPRSKYQVPTFDYSTADGAIAAMKNPARSVRFKAWQALHAMGTDAEAALLDVYRHDPNPRYRARALWLLGKTDGRGPHYVDEASKDADPNIRIVSIRLAGQLGMSTAQTLGQLAEDPDPQVRRELAVSLRFDDTDAMPGVFATLAAGYDGQDRWMLEALGIASDLRAADCFAAWMQHIDGQWDSPSGRELVWRLRAPESADLIADLLSKADLSDSDERRYFRAMEYHSDDVRAASLSRLVNHLIDCDLDDTIADRRIVRSVQRIRDFDAANRSPKIAAAIDRHVQSQRGTANYLTLIKRFQPQKLESAFESLMLSDGNSSAAVEALSTVLQEQSGIDRINRWMRDADTAKATRTIRLVGMLGNPRAMSMLSSLVANANQPFATRSAAIASMAGNNIGQKKLLELATGGKLPADTRLLVGGRLASVSNADIRNQAAKILPLPQQADHEPLAPLDQMAKMNGDVEQGRKLFRGVATCSNCHLVDGFGKTVGPDLSEIGSKLSREAMFTSILDPSAGISHNYENYVALLDSGQIITGVMVSETDDSVTLRTAEAIDREIDKDELEEIIKSEKSIMPENLHHTTDQQGLVDLVEYLMTLTKKE